MWGLVKKEIERITQVETEKSLDELGIIISATAGKYDGKMRHVEIYHQDLNNAIRVEIEGFYGPEDAVFDIMEEVRQINSYKKYAIKKQLGKFIDIQTKIQVGLAMDDKSDEVNGGTQPTSSGGNIIRINNGATPNIGGDLEYLGTYIKGKKGKVTDPKSLRLHVRNTNTGEEYLFFMHTRANFFGRTESSQTEIVRISEMQRPTPNHLKFKNYNYYHNGIDPSNVDVVLSAWANLDPMVSVGTYTKQFKTELEKTNKYTWTYEFNGVRY